MCPVTFQFLPLMDGGDNLVSKVCPALASPWTVAQQTPLSLGFPKHEGWNGLPFPSPRDLPNPGIEPRSPALQVDSLLTEPPFQFLPLIRDYFPTPQIWVQPYDFLWLTEWGRSNNVLVTIICFKKSHIFPLAFFDSAIAWEEHIWTSLLIPRERWGMYRTESPRKSSSTKPRLDQLFPRWHMGKGMNPKKICYLFSLGDPT